MQQCKAEEGKRGRGDADTQEMAVGSRAKKWVVRVRVPGGLVRPWERC